MRVAAVDCLQVLAVRVEDSGFYRDLGFGDRGFKSFVLSGFAVLGVGNSRVLHIGISGESHGKRNAT